MNSKFLILFFISTIAFAKNSSQKSDSRLTYDVSGAQGTQNGETYQEINIGLNWFLSDWLIWRNSAFQRQASNEKNVFGLDSSIRLQQEWINDDRTLGFKIFGGPGVRVASERYNAVFGEAGVGFRLGGIQLGAGIKSIQYSQSRTDNNNVKLPKNDNQVFFTISGSGTL